MRCDDRLEACVAREARGERLVSGEAVAVHEDDRDGASATRARLAQSGSERRRRERFDHRAVGAGALVRLDYLGIQRFRQADVPREDVGPVLVADAQRVPQTAGRHEHHRLAAAFEQRIGRHRGADLEGADAGFGAAMRADDRLRGGEARIGARLREHLAHVQAALGRAADHVGERAAAVDPELPIAHESLQYRPGERHYG